ncbi:nitroreductase family deazaflavin-dependent oxidoreductase [Actinoplanes sp. NPDC026619]|uniref:nitroreductase family deazaflavin-dependent oxidoreductase n=1 Tax=Actinoplanes sp. NPDC026619 TaxID=3155798 RepID=UPI0033F8E9EB
MKIVKRSTPPTGFSRMLWRLPILLYRRGLGGLLGRRIMLLTHTGRKTGRPRQAVIEVVEHDGTGYLVASGFGPRADWYRNVMTEPYATIQIGGRKLRVTAIPVPAEEGGELMARYAVRHPAAARRLCKLMGFVVDGSAEDYREVGRRVPFVQFLPCADS